ARLHYCGALISSEYCWDQPGLCVQLDTGWCDHGDGDCCGTNAGSSRLCRSAADRLCQLCPDLSEQCDTVVGPCQLHDTRTVTPVDRPERWPGTTDAGYPDGLLSTRHTHTS